MIFIQWCPTLRCTTVLRESTAFLGGIEGTDLVVRALETASIFDVWG